MSFVAKNLKITTFTELSISPTITMKRIFFYLPLFLILLPILAHANNFCKDNSHWVERTGGCYCNEGFTIDTYLDECVLTTYKETIISPELELLRKMQQEKEMERIIDLEVMPFIKKCNDIGKIGHIVYGNMKVLSSKCYAVPEGAYLNGNNWECGAGYAKNVKNDPYGKAGIIYPYQYRKDYSLGEYFEFCEKLEEGEADTKLEARYFEAKNLQLWSQSFWDCKPGYRHKIFGELYENQRFNSSIWGERGCVNIKAKKQEALAKKREKEESLRSNAKKRKTNKQNDLIVKQSTKGIVSKGISCETGFTQSINKKYCIKIPPNAHAVNSSTDAWICDEGYREAKNRCFEIKKEVGEKPADELKEETEKVVQNKGKSQWRGVFRWFNLLFK